MVAYFRNLEDQIKRSARRDGENRQKEEKRQTRRERRSPNQVMEIALFLRKRELFLIMFNMHSYFSHNVKNLTYSVRERKIDKIMEEEKQSSAILTMILCLVEME